MADKNELSGSCACERNQYTVIIPSDSTSQAQVFFDNSAASRKSHGRAQASPVTAWLRVPLEWYQSVTISQYPDESHSSIKRTFTTPAAQPDQTPTRRQFCGYCGTHLTAWHEGLRGEYMDVTLGSLLHESLETLEALKILSDADEEEGDSEDVAEKSAIKDTITEDDATNEGHAGGASDQSTAGAPASSTSRSLASPSSNMQSRGMPCFEEMVENSRLSRIRRRKGGHTSRDGSITIEWEVIEMDGPDEHMTNPPTAKPKGNKRQKLGQ